jgi:hypothetical protein
VALENAALRAVLQPALGGKMTSLVWRASGDELLLPPSGACRRPAYGDTFCAQDAYGFDECLPTVAPCRHPAGRADGIALPDHGELWSVPWRCEIDAQQVRMSVDGRALPYTVSKAVRLEGASVCIDYALTNRSDAPLAYLWAAHPLLRAVAGTRILLPSSVGEMWIESSRDERLGRHGGTCSWPDALLPNGDRLDLSLIRAPESKRADKLFTPPLDEGRATVLYPGGLSVTFRFDARVTPYLGVWICEGGWPASGPGAFTLALEPSSGRGDSLAEACGRGQAATLEAGASRRWGLRLDLAQEAWP